VRLCGATPRIVPSDIGSGWKPSAARLAKTATPATRGVIVNSPNNPTGAVIEAGELERILDWCASRHAYLIFDETYDRFLYGGRPQLSAVAHWAAHSDRIVVTGAASKTYAMTGWRLGWALARKELVSAMAAFQSHSTSNASTISQEAALVALTDLEQSEASVSRMLAEYARRREAMLAGLAAIPQIECVAPEGAFYVFPRVAAYYERKGVSGSVAFCEKLLAEAHVSAVAGEAFGEDSCIRFSFATSLERVHEGLRRFKAWLQA
jgi:aspartate aminotransferase